MIRCPHCSAEIIPLPFVGRMVCQCDMCERYMILTLDGASYESGEVRVAPAGRSPPGVVRSVH